MNSPSSSLRKGRGRGNWNELKWLKWPGHEWLSHSLHKVALLILDLEFGAQSTIRTLSNRDDEDNNNVNKQLVLWAKQLLCTCITLFSSLRGRRKKGRGREKSTKEGKGKGAFPSLPYSPPLPFSLFPYPLPVSTPATQASFLVHFFDIHCTTTTWNLRMRGSVAEWSARRTRNPAVPGSSPPLARPLAGVVLDVFHRVSLSACRFTGFLALLHNHCYSCS